MGLRKHHNNNNKNKNKNKKHQQQQQQQQQKQTTPTTATTTTTPTPTPFHPGGIDHWLHSITLLLDQAAVGHLRDVGVAQLPTWMFKP